MTAQILAAFILATMVASSIEVEDPLAQCKYLNNKSLAPLIYYSQSEIAVIGNYDASVLKDFNAGKKTDFFITPVCYIKGYNSQMAIHVYSGYQKCKITKLSALTEFPSLFFLRKDSESGNWILLNSGEYQHRADTSGLMFGVDPAGNDFPQVCGMGRKRIPIDDEKCESGTCKAYCSFSRAPSDDCKDLKTEMGKYMPKKDIPEEVLAVGLPTTPPPTTNLKEKKVKVRGTTSDTDNGSSGQALTKGLTLLTLSVALLFR